jgi:hypothetical protein
MDRSQITELGKARSLPEQASIILEGLVKGRESDAPEMDMLENADEPLLSIIAAIDDVLALEDGREEKGDDDEAEA